MKKLLFIILGFCLTTGAFAQQDPQYSQYMFNGLVLNPAYAGSRGHFSAVLLAREQWAGMEGAPSTQSISLHGTSRNRKHGFGFSLQNDKIGITSNTGVSAVYAFRIAVAEESFLSFGLQGSLDNYRANFNDVRLDYETDPQISDPAFTGNQVNLLLPNAGAGVYFHTRHFYLGASTPKLIRQNLYDSNTGSQAVQSPHYFFTGGLVLNLSDAVKFKPSVLAKYQPASGMQFDLNAHFLLADRLWLGASYRTEDAMVFMAEFQLTQVFRIGYAYDWTTSRLNRYENGSHEFMLGLDLDVKRSKMISPRYF